MNNQDIRWHPRFHQFDKAYSLLQDTITIEKLSIIERAGLIQFFERASELSWKLLKDYQQAEGYTINSPRDAIKQAFQSGLITSGHDWLNALEDRNLTTHTYNEQTALEVEKKIRSNYFPLLQNLHHIFSAKVNA
jgi:nucleotidyltransferase substrate binding protein (TIGR01987 family)